MLLSAVLTSARRTVDGITVSSTGRRRPKFSFTLFTMSLRNAVSFAMVRNTPPIFGMLQRMGSIPEHDMFNTYNMGVGMTMIVAKDDADKALAALKENGQDAYVIGEVVSGEEKVALC